MMSLTEYIKNKIIKWFEYQQQLVMTHNVFYTNITSTTYTRYLPIALVFLKNIYKRKINK